ncbi:MAG: hypothetical protein ACLVL2_02025 [Bacteroides cellulosilyticus]
MADDFYFEGRTYKFESVVKSSKMMQGKLEYIPSTSLVCPIMNDLPAVKTGMG